MNSHSGSSVDPVSPAQHQEAEEIQAVIVIAALSFAQRRVPETAQEIAGVDADTAREALRLAANKLPIKCKFVTKEETDGEQ